MGPSNPKPLTIESMIVVQITNKFKNIQISPARLKKLVNTVCLRFKLSEATVNINIVDNAEIRRLNKQFLSCNRVTDCLSFDLSDDDPTVAKCFELVVNAEKALQQARLRDHSSEAELALYITHGLLHNLGFDDSNQALAKKMHNTEDEILQQLGFGLVYNCNPVLRKKTKDADLT